MKKEPLFELAKTCNVELPIYHISNVEKTLYLDYREYFKGQKKGFYYFTQENSLFFWNGEDGFYFDDKNRNTFFETIKENKTGQ